MRFRVVASRHKWLCVLMGMASVWLVVASMAGAASEMQVENTYIEFIFDSSLSMRDRISDGASRMAVAKEVMRDVIGSLEDQPGLHIALRVYGSKAIDEYACRDSELFQAFGGVDEVRQSILEIVESLEPRGRTPIGLSLQLAADDFPMNPGDRNIIVLITDGQESCGVDPCQISLELQEKGIIMRPYVVGFAMSAAEEASVRCIGEYYSASDRDSLTEALSSIMVKAIAPPSLEISAYGGGQNVLDRTRIEILDSGGNKVLDERPGSVQTMRVSLDEGVYTIKGYLTVGTDTLTALASGVALTQGETTSVRLDFGSLTGSARVSARASGRDVSGQVHIEVLQSNRVIPVTWTGVPPTATLSVGEYIVKVTHRDYPSLSSQQTARISPDKETSITLDLGELPAHLEVTAQVMGRDITAQCQLAVVRGGRVSEQYGAGNSVFRHSGDPGRVDLQLVHLGDVRTEKLVAGTVLSGGETTKVVIDLSDVLGVIRATVLAGEKDVTADSRVNLDNFKDTLDLPQRGSYKEALVPAGFYGLKAFGRTGYESNTAEIDVVAGQVTTVTLRLNMPGTLVLRPTAGGRPVTMEKVSANVRRGQQTVAGFALVNGRLVAAVDPGTYDIACIYPSVPQQTRTVTGVSVDSGMTKEVAVDFASVGVLDVTVIAGNAPLDSAGVSIYQGETQLALMSTTGRPGRFQSEVVAGEYDLYAVPHTDAYRDQRVSGVQVPAGGQVQKEIILDAATRIRINAIMDGKPTSEARFFLYRARQTEEYVEIVETARQIGIFESYVDGGIYDLLVSPTVTGFKDRWIRGLEVPEGKTLERRVQIGGSGLFRASVQIDGRPTKQARLFMHEPGSPDVYHEMMYREDQGYYEIEIAEGTWDLEAVPEVSGARTRWIEGIEIWGGEVVSREISLGGKGTLRVTTLIDGKPNASTRVFAHPQLDPDDYYELLPVEGSPGVFALEIAEGIWDLEVLSDIGSIPTKWVTGVEVVGGQVLTQQVSLGGSGELVVRVMYQGRPYRGDIGVAAENPEIYDYWWLEQMGEGVYSAPLAEGVYDVMLHTTIEGVDSQRFRNIEVVQGQTTQKTLTLADPGTLRVRLMGDGEIYRDAYLYLEDDYGWVADLEWDDAGKFFSVDVTAGIYLLGIEPYYSYEFVTYRGVEIKEGEVLQRVVNLRPYD